MSVFRSAGYASSVHSMAACLQAAPGICRPTPAIGPIHRTPTICHSRSASCLEHAALRRFANNIQIAYPGEGSPHSLQAERLAKFTKEHFGHAQSPAAAHRCCDDIVFATNWTNTGRALASCGTWTCAHHALITPAGKCEDMAHLNASSRYSQLKHVNMGQITADSCVQGRPVHLETPHRRHSVLLRKLWKLHSGHSQSPAQQVRSHSARFQQSADPPGKHALVPTWHHGRGIRASGRSSPAALGLATDIACSPPRPVVSVAGAALPLLILLCRRQSHAAALLERDHRIAVQLTVPQLDSWRTRVSPLDYAGCTPAHEDGAGYVLALASRWIFKLKTQHGQRGERDPRLGAHRSAPHL